MGGSRADDADDLSPGSLVDPVAARGFDANAADYERGRPGYPAEVADVLATELGIAAGDRVCDLAAGTGKLTRLLLDRGLDVVAVEPVAGMRHQLEALLPGATVLDGSAEAIPLDDGDVDLVTVAQAFHWFRPAEACAEIRRVLKPGGGLAVVFNRRDESVPWVARMSEVLGWHDHAQSAYETHDWAQVITAGGFDLGGHRELGWEQPFDRELLASRVRSISYIGELDPADQQRHVDAVLDLVADQPDTFPLPYRTLLWWATAPA